MASRPGRRSHTASGCRRSRPLSASAWAGSSSRGRASRSRCCAGCRTRARRRCPRRRPRKRLLRTAARPVRALASPASLKGVLSAREAARLLADGFARAGVEAEPAPIADGGEGTAEVLGAQVVRRVYVPDAFGRGLEAPIWLLEDWTVVVESADAIPLDPARLDAGAASSRGFGELIAAVGECPRLLVCLGGTATMDAGAGLLDVLGELSAPTVALCDTRATLGEAPRAFGPQKGALADDIPRLEERLLSLEHGRSL